MQSFSSLPKNFLYFSTNDFSGRFLDQLPCWSYSGAMQVKKMGRGYNVTFQLYTQSAKGVGGGSDIEE
jgi:hypothetical protein